MQLLQRLKSKDTRFTFLIALFAMLGILAAICITIPVVLNSNRKDADLPNGLPNAFPNNPDKPEIPTGDTTGQDSPILPDSTVLPNTELPGGTTNKIPQQQPIMLDASSPAPPAIQAQQQSVPSVPKS